jgi:hypothetical protein
MGHSVLHCNANFGLLLGLQRWQELVEESYQRTAFSDQPPLVLTAFFELKAEC